MVIGIPCKAYIYNQHLTRKLITLRSVNILFLKNYKNIINFVEENVE